MAHLFPSSLPILLDITRLRLMMRDIIAEDEESGQIDALKASTRDTQRSSSTFIPFLQVSRAHKRMLVRALALPFFPFFVFESAAWLLGRGCADRRPWSDGGRCSAP